MIMIWTCPLEGSQKVSNPSTWLSYTTVMKVTEMRISQSVGLLRILPVRKYYSSQQFFEYATTTYVFEPPMFTKI